MYEQNGNSEATLTEQLETARSHHAAVFKDFLASPNRPLRLELEWASSAHKEILAQYHGVSASELAVLPEEQAAYTSEFRNIAAEQDVREASVLRSTLRGLGIVGSAGYFVDRLVSGDLYHRPMDIVVALVGAASAIRLDSTTDTYVPGKRDSWVIEDPFQLTREVIDNTPRRGQFFPKYDIQSHQFVDLNFRRQVRRQLLSRRRRIISTMVGQT